MNMNGMAQRSIDPIVETILQKVPQAQRISSIETVVV